MKMTSNGMVTIYNFYECTVHAGKFNSDFLTIQAEHCEDDLKTLETFKNIHDTKVGPLRDLRLLKLLHMTITECLKRHSTRATSNTVSEMNSTLLHTAT